MSRLKLLTKSKFKTGHECSNKLYFLSDRNFISNNTENEFLLALADGGFQVGELAKLYFPSGVAVETLDKDAALAETSELLKRDNVTIFEAAIKHGPFFIRIDILEKFGNSFRLHEVKSSTFDRSKVGDNGFFVKSRKSLASEWEPYLMDVAFQTFVLKSAFPEMIVSSNLALIDKDAVATVDGLNQRFVILPEGSKVKIRVQPGTNASNVGAKLIEHRCVDEEVQCLWEKRYLNDLDFAGYANWLAELYCNSKFSGSSVSNDCRSCEYRIPSSSVTDTTKSGFNYCLEKIEGLSGEALNQPFVFDVRNFWRKVGPLLAEKRFFMADLTEADVEPKVREDGTDGWHQTERQMLQVFSAKSSTQNVWVLKDELRKRLREWTYPYHFIDFETARVAIPFHKGRRPYEQIAFQFSHHIVESDGSVRHQTQYLNVERGQFPNFNFVRALRDALSKDNGTIFRYHTHENTVLNEIRKQLLASTDSVPDWKELVAFIESITYRKEGKGDRIEGRRCMVDLCDVVERYYFHRSMGGRTSIKKVFPAILNDSPYLQKKYSATTESLRIPSPARGNFTLVKFDDLGRILDPYADLPPVFPDMVVPD